MDWFDSYLDRQVDRVFRKRADGSVLYLPLGRGRGYVVTSDERHHRLRRFTRTMIMVRTLTIILAPSIALVSWRITVPFFILCGLAYHCAFIIGNRRLAGDLPRTAERFRLPGWREGIRLGAGDSARLYGALGLRVMLAVSTLFALMCTWAVVALPEMQLQAVGLVMLSAAVAVWTRYQLRVLREDDEAERRKSPRGVE